MSLWYRRLLWFATSLTLLVVVLGAYVRLTDAGLGCPDWPGCYGQLIPEFIDSDSAAANYPERPLETGKAWREMVHRYAASTLGFVIVLIALLAVRHRDSAGQPVILPLLTLAVVIFQGMLGMWTVTLMLKPVIVMGHLLGGLTTLSLLFWLLLEARRCSPSEREYRRVGIPAVIALIVLAAQIALGGWTSSNYAALACPDLPTCLGEWLPEQADFNEGFIMWRGIGVDYEFGVLEAPARVAIHVMHRFGALLATLVIGSVALWYGLRYRDWPPMRLAAAAVGVALLAQISLGLATVWFGLPLPVATAHNGVAAILLLTVINLNNLASRAPV
ncbi:MAG: COX15/CtaA family protein [Gammaproteobacteria bacterium]|jgi:cytochrome c oxidase assembly protein subunit 15|nr:COX15/CtaA family protein [Gammaproteobacteria bacterium]